MYPKDDDELTQFLMLYAQVSQITCADEIRRLNSKRQGTRLEKPTVPRERKTVTQVYRELGKHYFRRSFRMSYLTFGRLYRLLESVLKRVRQQRDLSPTMLNAHQMDLFCLQQQAQPPSPPPHWPAAADASWRRRAA